MMGEFALVLSSCGFIFILIFGIGRFDSFVNNKLLLQQFNAIFLYCLFFFYHYWFTTSIYLVTYRIGLF